MKLSLSVEKSGYFQNNNNGAYRFRHPSLGEPVVLFKTGFSLLSNFNPSTAFVVDGTRYSSGEAWYQASKAAHFKDWESHSKILALRSPKKIKDLGLNIKGYKDDEWEKVCISVMLRGVREKMTQNREARELLISTQNAIIGESSFFDSYWGTGIDIHDAAATDSKYWQGRNEMGKCSMKVRDDIIYSGL